jgi:WD40 repeat protein
MLTSNLKFALTVLLTATGTGAGAFLYQAAQAAEHAARPRPALVSLRHDDTVTFTALSCDGQLLASQAGKVVCLWETATGKQLRQIPLPGDQAVGVGGLAFSPDGQTLAWAGSIRTDKTAANALHLWNVATGRKIRTLEDPNALSFSALAFSPDGKLLATGLSERAVVIWEVESGKELHRLPALAFVYSVAFSPDGKKLAACRDMFFEKRNGVFLPGAGNDFLFMWDTATGQEIRAWEGHKGGACSIAFSPDGQLLASVGVKDKTLRFWELATGKEIRSLPDFGVTGRFLPPFHLAFSPDGKVLTLGNQQPMIRVADALTGVKTVVGKEGDTGVSEFVLLPDGGTLGAKHGGKIAYVQDLNELLKTARPRVGNLTPGELTSAWEDLAGDDVPRAYQALVRLGAAADRAVPFLHETIRALPAPDVSSAPKLVADLASDQFDVRQKAFDKLEKLGESARAALEKALANRPPLEVQRRVEQLLEKMAVYTPEHLRVLRAMQVLEQAGTPPAQEALQSLAKGAAGPRLAEEARMALKRLDNRRLAGP